MRKSCVNMMFAGAFALGSASRADCAGARARAAAATAAPARPRG